MPENRAQDTIPENADPHHQESLSFIWGASKQESSWGPSFTFLWLEAGVALRPDSPVSLLCEITDVLNVLFISLVLLNLPKEKCAAPPGRLILLTMN